MKNVIFILIIFIFSSCGEATIVGKWKQKAIVDGDGITIVSSEEYEFREDGTFTLSLFKHSGTATPFYTNGKWEYDSNSKTLILENVNGTKDSFNVTFSGTELRLKVPEFTSVYRRIQ